MTDIVERLRKFGGRDQYIWKVMDEAADKIEDLRYQVAFEEASRVNAFMELEKQDAKIKKLIVIIDDAIAWCNRNDEDPWWLEIAKEALEET